MCPQWPCVRAKARPNISGYVLREWVLIEAQPIDHLETIVAWVLSRSEEEAVVLLGDEHAYSRCFIVNADAVLGRDHLTEGGMCSTE